MHDNDYELLDLQLVQKKTYHLYNRAKKINPFKHHIW